MSVAVLGAGAFGTALAIALAGKQNVTLWGRDPDAMREMQIRRENHLRLAGHKFPEGLRPIGDLQDISSAQTILLAIPMQQLRSFLAQHQEMLSDRHLVACCKGMELASGEGPVSIITQTVPQSVAAILTGPSFAADIAKGLPTALTLACADQSTAKSLQAQLSTPVLRLYRTSDTLGAELGGALKNVIAIACGCAMGAGLGESARAALMTRGYAEMQRLALYLGAQPDTLAGLSGFGDLALTCSSAQSRNYRLGQAIGSHKGFDPEITVEGAATARAIDALAKRQDIDLPITSAVAALVENRLDVGDAMDRLLSRPLKEEQYARKSYRP